MCNDDVERYKRIVQSVQTLGLTELQELFKMLHKSHCHYTCNNNGVFINLNWASDEILDKIEQYVMFCKQSKKVVQSYESLRDVLNKKLHDDRSATKKQFENDNIPVVATKTSSLPCPDVTNKVSSSMRFYLLKKRYAKPTPPVHVTKNDLSNDIYIEY